MIFRTENNTKCLHRTTCSFWLPKKWSHVTTSRRGSRSPWPPLLAPPPSRTYGLFCQGFFRFRWPSAVYCRHSDFGRRPRKSVFTSRGCRRESRVLYSRHGRLQWGARYGNFHGPVRPSSPFTTTSRNRFRFLFRPPLPTHPLRSFESRNDIFGTCRRR